MAKRYDGLIFWQVPQFWRRGRLTAKYAKYSNKKNFARFVYFAVDDFLDNSAVGAAYLQD